MSAPAIHVQSGDRVKLVLDNQLPESTVIHFRGLQVPNSMDDVDPYTQGPGAARSDVHLRVDDAGMVGEACHVALTSAIVEVSSAAVARRANATAARRRPKSRRATS